MPSILNKKLIFSPGDICKVCNHEVWYYAGEPTIRDNKGYITCPTCNNEIQITE